MLLLLIEVIQDGQGTDPIVREIVLGVIGTGIVGYFLRENAKLKDRVKQVIDNHLQDLNKIIKDKEKYLQDQKITEDNYRKFAKDIIDALNNTKDKKE